MVIEAKNLNLDLDLLAYSGIVLTSEQRVSLETSFLILKEQYKFQTIYFWGKILGATDDYYIIQGRHNNELKDRQFLHSKDCINWNMLISANDEAKELTEMCQGRFTGDPTHDFEITKYNITNEDTEEENIEEYKSLLHEEERLAATLWKIQQDALIIPRGLTVLESGKLSNYFHFREPIHFQQKTFLYRQALDKSLHFLDSIDEDIPKGWTVQYERGSGLVQIRSLKWIGMAFFHIPETNRYGSLYCGIGEENKDLPFML